MKIKKIIVLETAKEAIDFAIKHPDKLAITLLDPGEGEDNNSILYRNRPGIIVEIKTDIPYDWLFLDELLKRAKVPGELKDLPVKKTSKGKSK